MVDSAFILKLGDGSGWLIAGSTCAMPWVETLARRMELTAGEVGRCGAWPTLFFVRRLSGKVGPVETINRIGAEIEKDLPRDGWKAHHLRSLRVWSHRAAPDVICEIGNEDNHEMDTVRMWTALYIIYLRVQDSGGLPVHTALVERDGKGVLLAGPGGAGKSTLCRHLPRPWCALSDDQALIVRDDRNGYLAHPIPTWSDSLWGRSERTWKVEHDVPLAAIFFVEQARSDEVVPIGQGQAAVCINRSSTDVCRPLWRNLSNEEERKLKKKLFDNACKLARGIPAYILHVSLTGRSWEEMEKVL